MKRLQSVQIFPLYSGAKVQNHFDLQIKVICFLFYNHKFNIPYYSDRVIEINLLFIWWFQKKFSNLPDKTIRKMNLVIKNMCCMMWETSAGHNIV